MHYICRVILSVKNDDLIPKLTNKLRNKAFPKGVTNIRFPNSFLETKPYAQKFVKIVFNTQTHVIAVYLNNNYKQIKIEY